MHSTWIDRRLVSSMFTNTKWIASRFETFQDINTLQVSPLLNHALYMQGCPLLCVNAYWHHVNSLACRRLIMSLFLLLTRLFTYAGSWEVAQPVTAWSSNRRCCWYSFESISLWQPLMTRKLISKSSTHCVGRVTSCCKCCLLDIIVEQLQWLHHAMVADGNNTM